MSHRLFFRKLWTIFRYVLLLIIIVLTLFPIYYTIMTSLKTPILTYNPEIWLFKPTFENYVSLFTKYNITPYFINSIIITAVSVVVTLVLASLTAYGFAKFNFKNKDGLAGWILSIRFLPAISGIIPLFLLGNFFHILDTYFLLIISYLTFNLPFAIWMLRGFFEEIPHEIEEAAFVDGANRLQTLIKIVIPLVGPGLFATSALLIIQTWNEFALALFLATNNSRTMPTITSQFQTVRGIVWGEMTALALLTTLPVFFFAIVARKYLVRGLTLGAVK